MHDLDLRQIYITLLLCIAVRITEYTVKKVSDFSVTFLQCSGTLKTSNLIPFSQFIKITVLHFFAQNSLSVFSSCR
jgi:hypothetical protein